MEKPVDIEERTPRDRAQAILTDVLRRRAGGESVDDEAVLAANSDLADELKLGLSRLRLIQTASDKASEFDAAHTVTFSPELTPRAAGTLAIRCPHCQEQFETSSDTPVTDIVCDSCGNRFSLAGTGAELREAAALASLGHFDLIERIGIGGFGTVWKGRDRKLDRIVAIKIPRQGSLDPADLEKFLREARAAAQLNHPHIVGIYEVGSDGERAFIVGEYVRGVTLERWLARQRPTLRQAASQCIFIAEALHHAHEQGVIHRDLKPGNIMIGTDGRPRVMDFGLARRQAGEVTMTLDGQLLGTPAYMSPEQALGRGHDADRRSDVYSLGVILFELVTGERPFRGEYLQLIQQVVDVDPPSPRTLNGSIPRDLETITLKCLEKEPARRYASAQELADDLRRYLRGAAIRARTVGPWERVWRWARRQPLVAGMCAVVALLVVASGATTVELWRSRANLKSALATAENQTQVAEEQSRLAEQLSKEAQDRERQANIAMQQLKTEMEARQAAELGKATELVRRMELAKELEHQTESFTKQEQELRDLTAARTIAEKELDESTRARTMAETEASRAQRARDEAIKLARESAWYQYTDSLSQADEFLTRDDLEAARKALDACPQELRGWEWTYFYQLASRNMPMTDMIAAPDVNARAVAIADDVSALVAQDTGRNALIVYQAMPLSVIDSLKGFGYVGKLLIQRNRDNPNLISVVQVKWGPSSLWLLENGRKRRITLEKHWRPTTLSSDGSFLYGPDTVSRRSGHTIYRLPTLTVASATSGEKLAEREFKVNVDVRDVPEISRIVLGNGPRMAIFGKLRYSSKLHLWLCFADSSTSTVVPEFTVPTSLSRPSSAKFNSVGDLLVIGDDSRYQVVNATTGEILERHVCDRNTLILAISPDNSRILSMDSEGVVLRTRGTGKTLPRLKQLPWGRWNSRLRTGSEGNDQLAINDEWTRCLGTGDVTGPDGQTSRAIFSWDCTAPQPVTN